MFDELYKIASMAFENKTLRMRHGGAPRSGTSALATMRQSAYG